MKAKRKFTPLKRPRFFEGQLLSAKDLEAEQQYFREKQKRHNVSLHGYGVVSGLDISTEENGAVIISCGMAVDAFGNEVVVPDCLQIPIKQRRHVAYVVVRYHENETDPVPVQIDSNGGVEFSRIEEGFEIAITPTAGPNPSARKTAENQMEPGVILARLVMRRGRWQVDRKFRRPRTR
jgi:hypothetical protein